LVDYGWLGKGGRNSTVSKRPAETRRIHRVSFGGANCASECRDRGRKEEEKNGAFEKTSTEEKKRRGRRGRNEEEVARAEKRSATISPVAKEDKRTPGGCSIISSTSSVKHPGAKSQLNKTRKNKTKQSNTRHRGKLDLMRSYNRSSYQREGWCSGSIKNTRRYT